MGCQIFTKLPLIINCSFVLLYLVSSNLVYSPAPHLLLPLVAEFLSFYVLASQITRLAEGNLVFSWKWSCNFYLWFLPCPQTWPVFLKALCCRGSHSLLHEGWGCPSSWLQNGRRCKFSTWSTGGVCRCGVGGFLRRGSPGDVLEFLLNSQDMQQDLHRFNAFWSSHLPLSQFLRPPKSWSSHCGCCWRETVFSSSVLDRYVSWALTFPFRRSCCWLI